MYKSSETTFLVATIHWLLVVTNCITPDFSAYGDSFIECCDGKTIKLGFAVSNETKHLMEVQNFKNRRGVNMYVRIAPKSDPDELKDAQRDYEETKKKIEEKHPDTVSTKTGHLDRRVIGVPDFGFGHLRKKGKETVPCYYFVVEYSDDYSDYAGGTIVGQDGSSIQIDENWKNEFDHTFKVKTINDKGAVKTFVRMAPLSNFLEVATTIGDWDSVRQGIENPNITDTTEKPSKITSEGNGILKMDGKDDIPCYYFTIEYAIQKIGKKRKAN